MFTNKCSKSRFVWVIAVLVFMISFLVFPGEVPAAEKVISLTYAESGPPAGLGGNFVKIMKEEIEKKTDGRVALEIYWQGSLLKGKEILNGVKNGLVDMGYVLPAYYPKQLFMHNAFALFPEGPTKFHNLSRAITNCYSSIPEFKEELEAWNQKVLFMRFMLPMALCSTKPFTEFEDFRGLRVRASSANYLKALKGAGATPVSVPWSDCYMALQTGTIDSVFTNYDGIFATKLDEPGREIFTARELWVPMPIFVTINLNKWNSLPEDIQKGLMKANESVIERFSSLFALEWERIQLSQKERGCNITEASKEDISKWVELAVWDELRGQWVEEAEKRGIQNGREIISSMEKYISAEIKRENS